MLVGTVVKHIRVSCCLWVICMVAGCIVVQEYPSLPTDSKLDKRTVWEARRQHLQHLQTWSFKARVAGKYNDDGFRVGIRWRQRLQQFDIDLHGLLGRRIAIINGREDGVQINIVKGESYFAHASEDWMENLFGYPLPMNSLRYWIRGIPDPEQAHVSLQLDDRGRLRYLEQMGWKVNYKRYHNDELALPAFINLSNADFTTNIIIDRWH